MNDIFFKLNGIGAETKEALNRFLNNEEMYLKYIRSFPEEPSMGLLREAVSKSDYDSAEKAVHALKGIVKNLGFVPLADAAVDMLEELRDENVDAALEAFEDVEEEYDKYCDVINEWRQDN